MKKKFLNVTKSVMLAALICAISITPVLAMTEEGEPSPASSTETESVIEESKATSTEDQSELKEEEIADQSNLSEETQAVTDDRETVYTGVENGAEETANSTESTTTAPRSFKDSVTVSAGLERSYDGTAWDPHAVLKDKETGEVLEEDEHYTRELYYYGARENGEIKAFHEGRPDYVNPGILEERFYPEYRGSSDSSGEDVVIVRHITYNDIIIKGTDYSAVEGGKIDMPQYEKISNGPIMIDNVPEFNAEVSIERWGEAMVLEDPEVGYIAGKPGKYNIIPMQRGLHEAIPNDGKVVDIFDNVWWAYADNLDVAYQTGGVIRLLYRNGVLTITPKQDPNPNPDPGPGPNPNPNPNPDPGPGPNPNPNPNPNPDPGPGPNPNPNPNPNPDPGFNPGNNPAPNPATPAPSQVNPTPTPKAAPVEVSKTSQAPNTGDANNPFSFVTAFTIALVAVLAMIAFINPPKLKRKDR